MTVCKENLLRENKALKKQLAQAKKANRLLTNDIRSLHESEKIHHLALKQSEQHYGLLFETLLQGIVFHDQHGTIISMNDAASEILGLDKKALQGSSSVQLEKQTIRENGSPFPGIEHPAMVSLRTGVAMRNVVMGVFNQNENKYRWISIDSIPLFRPGETLPFQVYTLFNDISDRKLAEENLKQRERENALLARILELSSRPFAVGNLDGSIGQVNRAFETLTGYSQEELAHLDWKSDLTPSEYNAIEDRILDNLLQTGEPVTYEKEYIRKNGTRVPIELLAHVKKDPEGNPEFFFAFLSDITERKKYEQNLELKVEQRTSLLKITLKDLDAERQRFHDVINLIPAYVALITRNHEIAFANKYFTEYFGEVNNQKCFEILFGRAKVCQNCKGTKVISGLTPVKWESGCRNNRIYQISDYPFTDIDGTSMILEIGVDITDKKNLEKFVLSKVMETEERDRRRFAIDLHDDLGPTLSAIKIQFSLLGKVKTPEEREKLLTTCDQLLTEGIEKIRTVANNIMPNLIESYGLETALKSFINKIETSAKLSFNVHSNLKGWRCDKESELHLYRILTELINNTIKHARATAVSLKLNLSKKMLQIDYSDNGIGYEIDDNPLQATGIGLQSIRNRVALINGTVDFNRKAGKTNVMISKPICDVPIC